MPLASDILAQHSTLYAVGFKLFWQPTVRRFFPDHQLVFIEPTAAPLPAGSCLLVWGLKALPASLTEQQVLLRLEDGFIRSVGLGAEFAQPLSWVVDAQGLYFDATQSSDLEYLLNHIELDQQQRQRADALVEKIVRYGLSKYNVGAQTPWQRPAAATQVHLIVGQVESDASIARGTTDIRSNLDLVKAVRAQFPDAYLIYKPHPDVVAKARAAGSDLSAMAMLVDEVVVDKDIHLLFSHIDALHCMTSLSGFEALLRGVAVHCYGLPFYAGWGLTHDHASAARRQRSLQLSELVYATLIAYPRYLDARTGQACQVEQAIDCLVQQRQQAQRLLPRLQQLLKRAIRRLKNVWQGGAL